MEGGRKIQSMFNVLKSVLIISTLVMLILNASPFYSRHIVAVLMKTGVLWNLLVTHEPIIRDFETILRPKSIENKINCTFTKTNFLLPNNSESW